MRWMLVFHGTLYFYGESMRTILLTAVSLFLIGCEEEPLENTVEECEEDAQLSSDIDDEVLEEEQEDIILLEGIWMYSQVYVSDDRCGFSESFQEDLVESITAVQYEIDHVAEGNYIISLIVAEGLEIPTSCQSEGLTLNCEPIELNVPAFGTLLNETYTSYGTIDTGYRIEGRLEKEYACEGDECSEAQELLGVSFPCSVDLQYTLNFFD